jgi:hypothetical protein
LLTCKIIYVTKVKYLLTIVIINTLPLFHKVHHIINAQVKYFHFREPKVVYENHFVHELFLFDADYVIVTYNDIASLQEVQYNDLQVQSND